MPNRTVKNIYRWCCCTIYWSGSIYRKPCPTMKKTYPQEYYKKLGNIAALIKEYRLNSGYSQMELAENLNLHRNTLSRAEGAKNMTVLTLIELCETLELDMSELFYEM